MLEPKLLRSDIAKTAERLATRQFDLDVAISASLKRKESNCKF